jgi:hypothetical protein
MPTGAIRSILEPAKSGYDRRMMIAMRTRLLVALGLSCAIAPGAACKKSDDTDVSGVGNEATRRKPHPTTTNDKPPVPPKKDFVPDEAKYQLGGGSCPTHWFCTNQPDKTPPKDVLPGKNDTPLDKECGETTTIPASVAAQDFAGRQAYFNSRATEEVRKDEPDTCCFTYRTGPCGKGRPLRHEGAPVLADEVRRDGWNTATHDVEAVARDLRAHASGREVDALVAHLRHVALLEHASVAAFARVSLELLALGAPSELVAASHVAAMDEIRHAELCWSLLTAIEGAPRGPSPMSLPPFAAVDPDEVLVSTVIDGCVGETLGSLLFHESARRCAVPSLAAVYRSIADEEAEHATLAFRIVRFLVGRDPKAAERAHALAQDVVLPTAAEATCDRLGILDEAAQHHVHTMGLRDVVLPVLALIQAPVVA